MVANVSSKATSFKSVQLLVLFFCFLELRITAPSSSEIIVPVCPLQSAWV